MRVRHQLRQQMTQVSAQPHDLLLAEVGAIVAEFQTQAGPQLDAQGQRVVSALMVVQPAEGQACGRALLECFGHREVFKHQQGVEQRRALLTGPRLDVVERHMLMVAQAEVQGLQLTQPGARRLGRRGGTDDGQGVNEQAQLLFNARQRR
ncbi:hypothetical protein PFUM301597_00840 [Pseudomonas fluorescens]